MINNPMFYDGIITHQLVALPGFLIISSVSGIVNVMPFVVPAAACVLILCSLESITIAQWAE
jgi:Na+/alanine symporter